MVLGPADTTDDKAPDAAADSEYDDDSEAPCPSGDTFGEANDSDRTLASSAGPPPGGREVGRRQPRESGRALEASEFRAEPLELIAHEVLAREAILEPSPRVEVVPLSARWELDGHLVAEVSCLVFDRTLQLTARFGRAMRDEDGASDRRPGLTWTGRPHPVEETRLVGMGRIAVDLVDGRSNLCEANALTIELQCPPRRSRCSPTTLRISSSFPPMVAGAQKPGKMTVVVGSASSSRR